MDPVGLLSDVDLQKARGPYQGMRDFPAEDVARMVRMETRTLADVVDSVSVLESAVHKLEAKIGNLVVDMRWTKWLIEAIFLLLLSEFVKATFAP